MCIMLQSYKSTELVFKVWSHDFVGIMEFENQIDWQNS